MTVFYNVEHNTGNLNLQTIFVRRENSHRSKNNVVFDVRLQCIF